MIQEVQRLSCVAPQTIPHRLYLSTFASYVCFLNTFYVCRFYFGLCNKSPMKGDKGCDPGGLQHPKRLLCLGKPDWLYAGSQHFGLPTIGPLFGPFSINPRIKCKDHSYSHPGPRCLGRTSRIQARKVPICLLEVTEPSQGSWRSVTVVYV